MLLWATMTEGKRIQGGQQPLTRREALMELGKRAAKFGIAAGVVGGVTEVDALRVFSETHPILPEKRQELQREASVIVEQGLIRVHEFSPVERTVGEQKRMQRPILNPQGIAESLLYMAYMEGGDENVSKMSHFLENVNGITVREGAKGANGEIDTISNPFSDEDFSVELNPEIFSENGIGTISHELYHVEQQARGNFLLRRIIGAGIVGAIGMGIFYGTAINNTSDQKSGFSRRRLLMAGLRLGLIGSCCWLYYALFTPMERQAYVQAGGKINGLGKLTSQEPIKSALESIVTFEDVE